MCSKTVDAGPEVKKGHRSILMSSSKMAAATMLSRVLGLVREQVMAMMFGAGWVTDCFLIAYRIPNLLRDLLAEGAFSSAFVPTFTELKQRRELDARRFLWTLFILLSLVAGSISLGIVIFARPLTHLFAPDFKNVPERFEMTVSLLRIMGPYLWMASIAALFMGALNSLKSFFIPSLSTAFFNVVMISSTLFLPSVLHYFNLPTVWALAIGVIGGGIVAILSQLPIIVRKNFGPLFDKEVWNIWTPQTRKILNRVGIGTIGIAATQINLLISSILATGAGVGAVSWLTYAFRLFQFPVGIVGVSIAGSNLVHFSESWKAGNKAQAQEFLKSSYGLSMLVLIPAMVLLYSLSDQCTHLIFQRGRFTFYDTQMTALALRWYVLGLPFYGIYKLFAPTFYVLDRPRIPVLTSTFCVGMNILFCTLCIKHFGFSVLAFGTTLSMSLNVLIQSYFLKKHLQLDLSFYFNKLIGKIFIAAIVTFFALRWCVPRLFDSSQYFAQKVIALALLVAIGGGCYLISLLILGEWKRVQAIIRKRQKK